MDKMPGKIPVIKSTREDDLDRITEIDRIVLEKKMPECWVGKVEMAEKRSLLPSSVA